MSELEQQTGCNADHDSDCETAKEHQHKYTNRLEQTEYCELASLRTRLILLRSLKQHNSNSIVQDGLAKDNGVQFRVDFVGIEDSKNCYRIRSAQSCANTHGFDKADVQTL